ncbi:hypothetical protein [Devosia sp.]|uniref:hypothetical protein n=1 Tax=Devosia sp. TaxID=1871048 RepID=UPI0032635742
MFNADDATEEWSLLDRIGVAACCAVLLGFAMIAPIGPGRGFVTTRAYSEANIWVGLACAVLCALCALYVIAQLLPATGWRGTIATLVVACAAGYYCALSSVPAVLGESRGTTGTVIFQVNEITIGGSRNCGRAIARNLKYDDFSQCARSIVPRPQLGDRLEITGKVSEWGVQPKQIRVLR